MYYVVQILYVLKYFCLFDILVSKRGVLKSATLTVDMPFLGNSVSFVSYILRVYFQYLESFYIIFVDCSLFIRHIFLSFDVFKQKHVHVSNDMHVASFQLVVTKRKFFLYFYFLSFSVTLKTAYGRIIWVSLWFCRLIYIMITYTFYFVFPISMFFLCFFLSSFLPFIEWSESI